MTAVLADGDLLWGAALLLCGLILTGYTAAFRRRNRRDAVRLAEAERLGIHRPPAQFPDVDPRRCIGCGTCVAACPEGDVLGIVGGLAVVVNGLRCVGHGTCEIACPVGAIEVGLGDVRQRRDIPWIDDGQQSNVPGLFIAGELGGLSLIHNAVEQGRRAVEGVAAALAASPPRAADPGRLDLLVVGAGPAGLAAALTAAERSLSYLVLEQEGSLGGTIFKYPRRKLVMVQPLELPLHGSVDEPELFKEELLGLVHGLVDRHGLEIRFGERVVEVRRDHGGFAVDTAGRTYHSRFVVLAVGRRGTPRQLGVPGETPPRVLYEVRDAEQYRQQRILCVGGGDSAVEAAIGLSRQPGNEVTISYRGEGFYRVKKKNLERLEQRLKRGRVTARLRSRVLAIEPASVLLQCHGGEVRLANDQVFMLIGGTPPFPLLERAGVRFGGDGRSAPAAGNIAAGAGPRQPAAPRPRRNPKDSGSFCL